MPTISMMDYAASCPDAFRRALVQKITNDSVFLKILRFIPIPTFTYTYGEQATLGGIAFRNLNELYTGDAGIVNPKSETARIFGGLVKTDRQLMQGDPLSPRANSIAAKLKRAGLYFDAAVINGDTAVNPKGFDGLAKRISGKQIITIKDDVGNGSVPMAVDIDKLLDAVPGPNNRKILIANKRGRRAIQATAVRFGVQTFTQATQTIDAYDGAVIWVVDEDGDDVPIISNAEHWGTSIDCTSIYCIRPGQDVEGEWVQGLVKASGDPRVVEVVNMIEHEFQGMINTYAQDLVEAAMGLAIFHGRAAARLVGIRDIIPS